MPVVHHQVIKSDKADYFEDDTGTSQGPKEIVFKEECIIIPIDVASAPLTRHMIDQDPMATHDDLVDQVV